MSTLSLKRHFVPESYVKQWFTTTTTTIKTRVSKLCGIHVLHLYYSGKALWQHYLRHWYVLGLQYWHMSDNDDDTKTDNRPHCDMIEVVWQASREKVSDTACGSMSVVVSGCESETDCREISQSAISRKKTRRPTNPTIMRRQTAVSAHFSSEGLLLFAFAGISRRCLFLCRDHRRGCSINRTFTRPTCL